MSDSDLRLCELQHETEVLAGLVEELQHENDRLKARVEQLMCAIADNVPCVTLVRTAPTHEWTGDVTLTEDEAITICKAFDELVAALKNGEGK